MKRIGSPAWPIVNRLREGRRLRYFPDPQRCATAKHQIQLHRRDCRWLVAMAQDTNHRGRPRPKETTHMQRSFLGTSSEAPSPSLTRAEVEQGPSLTATQGSSSSMNSQTSSSLASVSGDGLALSERSGASSTDSSPVVNLSMHTLSAPAELSTKKNPGGAVIEPQNPFDQIPVVAPPPLPVSSPVPTKAISGAVALPLASDLSSATLPVDLGNSPPSPDRSAGGGLASVPPSPLEKPFDRLIASAPSTPIDTKGATLLPQSAPPHPHNVHPTNLTYDRAQTEHRNTTYNAAPPRVQQVPPQPVFDDDENTEPSSEANASQQRDEAVVAGSIVRFWDQTRKRLTSHGALSDDGMADGVLICGYLRKLGRNGKWQTRWFETDGECLSYYKTNKRSKLLATLDLSKVGAIAVDEADSKGTAFSIQVLGRLYHLRAESKVSCKDWVITLNRVKEARLNQGNVKLVAPSFQSQPLDFLDPHRQSDDMVAPRVVVVANRQRTRAVDESQEWDKLIRVDGKPVDGSTLSDPFDIKRRSALGTAVVARWSKRRSSLSRLGTKFIKWARSLKKYRCTQIEEEGVAGVALDHHVHPPGHDDKRHKVPPPVPAGGDQGLSGWIGKEKQQTGGVAPHEDDDNIIEAPGISASPAKPVSVARGYSSASDDIRMIS